MIKDYNKATHQELKEELRKYETKLRDLVRDWNFTDSKENQSKIIELLNLKN